METPKPSRVRLTAIGLRHLAEAERIAVRAWTPAPNEETR